jgi:hypothetical protein
VAVRGLAKRDPPRGDATNQCAMPEKHQGLSTTLSARPADDAGANPS